MSDIVFKPDKILVKPGEIKLLVDGKVIVHAKGVKIHIQEPANQERSKS